MPTLDISITTKRQLGLLRSSTIGSEALRYLANVVMDVSSGREPSDGVRWHASDITALGDQAFNAQACGVLIGATFSGVVGATIDGTLVTATAAGGDIATAGLIAAAIRANTAVNRKVTATNIGMQFTLASVLAGQYIDIDNTRFTGVTTAPTQFGEFQRGVTDTADALSLSLAFNRHPSVSMRWRAVSVLGVVHLFPTTDRTARNFMTVVNQGAFATFTIQTPFPVATNKVGIIAIQSGPIGECCTVVLSGLGITYASAIAGKLGDAKGGGTTPFLVVP